MRWSELSADMAVWTVPAKRAKNGAAHVVHLAPEARALLAGVTRFAGSDLVFTTTGKAAVSGYSKAKARVNAAIAKERAEAAAAGGADPDAMPGWRWHDFRRSCVTWLAGPQRCFPHHVSDKLLNHVATTGLSDVGRIYQRAQFLAERKAALEAWARHVVACGEGEGADESNVVAANFGARREEVA